MSAVRDTIHVNVEYFDGQEEGDVGYPYYVASCIEITATTDGETLDELFRNIGEVIALCLEDVDSVAEYGLALDAKVMIMMELPKIYAQTI
jgi:predicted RNase H-like HicB family nuclease